MNDKVITTDFNENDRVVAQAIEESGKVDSNEIHLSTGVVLMARPANPTILMRVMTAIPRPQPPTWTPPGSTKLVENPDDPDYIDRVHAWERNYQNSMVTAMIQLGTTLHSWPDGFEGPQSNEWVNEYELLGMPIHPQSAAWRYQAWVMFRAAPTAKDLELIMKKVGSLSGVSEADVRNVENFPAGDKKDRV